MMKDISKNTNPELVNNELEISCGNSWGQQEYLDGYIDKAIDIKRDEKDNFISRFVNKYINK